MAYPKPSIASVNGRNIRIAHETELAGPSTYLTAAVAAAGVTMTVADNGGFANTNLIRVGHLGSETCEIVSVNAAVTHGTSLTSTALTFAHDPGEPVQFVQWDQWKIYGNTTDTTTAAVLIATVDQTPDGPYTSYVNSGTEYAYYFALGYDSVNAATSDAYSDGVPYTGYAETSVGSICDRALRETGTARDELRTDRWLLDQINDCSKELRRELKTWSFLQCFGYALGQTSRGSYEFTLPTDIGDANSVKSILNVYLDGHDDPMTYVDREDWIDETDGMVTTQVRTQATAGDLTLAIDDSYGFDDSGSVNFYISGTQYTVTYTAVTRSTTAGVLTGVPAAGSDGAITVTVPVDTNVFQDETEGEPVNFEVSDGKLRIWPLPDASHDDLNLRMDYYTGRTAADSMGDSVDSKAYDMFLHWMKWKCRGSLNATGMDDLTDPDFLQFRDILAKEVRREVSGQRRRWSPQMNRITY